MTDERMREIRQLVMGPSPQFLPSSAALELLDALREATVYGQALEQALNRPAVIRIELTGVEVRTTVETG